MTIISSCMGKGMSGEARGSRQQGGKRDDREGERGNKERDDRGKGATGGKG